MVADNIDITMVGGGVVSLIASYYLMKHGYSVEVIESIPDPRNPDTGIKGSGSATFAGEDARIFSFNEARHHTFGRHCPSTKINTLFRRYFHEGGWLGVSLKQLSIQDIRWLQHFEQISESQGREFDTDIISFNRESAPLWNQLKSDLPGVFEDGNCTEGLLRLYASKEAFSAGIKQELSIGSFDHLLDATRVKQEHPILVDAVDTGAIEEASAVKGFSVNSQSLCRSLIDLLEIEGVKFRWQSPVESIQRSRNHVITGVVCNGELLSRQNYVISAGASGHGLLRGFLSEGLIAPVFGMWLTIPNTGNHPVIPMKISRTGFASPGAAEGANVIPGKSGNGEPVLHISSGHGYMGIGQRRPNWFWAQELSKAAHETAQSFFPKQYRTAIDRDMLNREPSYCVRPWTPSGLGIFEKAPTDQGGTCCVVGGNSTGGFAQAPSIAQAILCAFSGESHRMHRLYSPERTLPQADELAFVSAG